MGDAVGLDPQILELLALHERQHRLVDEVSCLPGDHRCQSLDGAVDARRVLRGRNGIGESNESVGRQSFDVDAREDLVGNGIRDLCLDGGIRAQWGDGGHVPVGVEDLAAHEPCGDREDGQNRDQHGEQRNRSPAPSVSRGPRLRNGLDPDSGSLPKRGDLRTQPVEFGAFVVAQPARSGLFTARADVRGHPGIAPFRGRIQYAPLRIAPAGVRTVFASEVAVGRSYSTGGGSVLDDTDGSRLPASVNDLSSKRGSR